MSFNDRFHEISTEVRNWGRWGDDDRLGTLNHLVDVLQIRLITLERLLSTSHILDTRLLIQIRRKYGTALMARLSDRSDSLDLLINRQSTNACPRRAYTLCRTAHNRNDTRRLQRGVKIFTLPQILYQTR